MRKARTAHNRPLCRWVANNNGDWGEEKYDHALPQPPLQPSGQVGTSPPPCPLVFRAAAVPSSNQLAWDSMPL